MFYHLSNNHIKDIFKAVGFNISQPFLYALDWYYNGVFSGLFARFGGGQIQLVMALVQVNKGMGIKWLKSAYIVLICGLCAVYMMV